MPAGQTERLFYQRNGRIRSRSGTGRCGWFILHPAFLDRHERFFGSGHLCSLGIAKAKGANEDEWTVGVVIGASFLRRRAPRWLRGFDDPAFNGRCQVGAKFPFEETAMRNEKLETGATT